MNQVFLIFNISGGEFLIVALIFLLFFGPNKIPEMARAAAKGIKMVKNATNDIKREILDSTDDQTITEVKSTLEEGKEAFKEVVDSVKRGTKL